MLASPVSPQLLARDWLMLVDQTLISFAGSVKGIYTSTGFPFFHSASLDQSFLHCLRFLTADSSNRGWTVLSSNVVDHSSKSTKDHGLGEPLPHQLPNPTWASLKAGAGAPFEP